MIQRYDVPDWVQAEFGPIGNIGAVLEESDLGPWVKWEDVVKLIEMEVDTVEYDYQRAAGILATIDALIVREGFGVMLKEEDS